MIPTQTAAKRDNFISQATYLAILNGSYHTRVLESFFVDCAIKLRKL